MYVRRPGRLHLPTRTGNLLVESYLGRSRTPEDLLTRSDIQQPTMVLPRRTIGCAYHMGDWPKMEENQLHLVARGVRRDESGAAGHGY